MREHPILRNVSEWPCYEPTLTTGRTKQPEPQGWACMDWHPIETAPHDRWVDVGLWRITHDSKLWCHWDDIWDDEIGFWWIESQTERGALADEDKTWYPTHWRENNPPEPPK